MKYYLILILVCLGLLSCRKESIDEFSGVMVFDYLTGQPLNQAQVLGIQYHSCGPWVIGYCGQTDTLLGYTNAQGKFDDNRAITAYAGSDLEIRKEPYYPSGRFRNCLYKKDFRSNAEAFRLFRKAVFEISTIARQAYTDPRIVLHVFPLLSDGSVLELTEDYFREKELFPPVSATFYAFGAGDMNNRIIVLKRSASWQVDTLFRGDFFLPANSIKPVDILY